jgi:hypothetical protein
MYSSDIAGAIAHARTADRISRAEHQRQIRTATGRRSRFRITFRRNRPQETGHVVLQPVLSS